MHASLPPQPPSSSAAAQQQTSNLLSNIERANFKDSIMIHVIDDSKNEKRDFTFSRSLLVKYMKYFDKCLKKISDQDEIDISIHCDAVIFEWLLNSNGKALKGFRNIVGAHCKICSAWFVFCISKFPLKIRANGH